MIHISLADAGQVWNNLCLFHTFSISVLGVDLPVNFQQSIVNEDFFCV